MLLILLLFPKSSETKTLDGQHPSLFWQHFVQAPALATTAFSSGGRDIRIAAERPLSGPWHALAFEQNRTSTPCSARHRPSTCALFRWRRRARLRPDRATAPPLGWRLARC